MALRVTNKDNRVIIQNEIGMNPNGFEFDNGLNTVMVLCDRLYVYKTNNPESIYERNLNEKFSIVVRGKMVFDNQEEYDKCIRNQLFVILGVFGAFFLIFIIFVYFTGI